MFLLEDTTKIEIEGIDISDTVKLVSEQGEYISVGMLPEKDGMIKLYLDYVEKGVYYLMINDVKLEKIIFN